MGITDLCPIRYGLLFERFLNPERVSPPDIDVDFCPDRREEVIAYVRNKYGERAVAQIITFGTMGAKMAVRDVGRVMGMSFGETSRIADLIPKVPGAKLADALKQVPELKNLAQEDSVKPVIEAALQLEDGAAKRDSRGRCGDCGSGFDRLSAFDAGRYGCGDDTIFDGGGRRYWITEDGFLGIEDFDGDSGLFGFGRKNNGKENDSGRDTLG